ncbi:heme o synthase [Dehalococcoidia bacterium]|nr:heme o synthase [Dehalococcoidia bacterium]
MATATLARPSAIRNYLRLTKPQIVAMVAFTALGGLFLGSAGAPDPVLVVVVLAGGSLAAGGANAINHYLDRDIDERMHRTRQRPVVVGSIHPRKALWFGILLNVISFIVLTVFVNELAAILTLGATLFYVFVYTRGLKRTTPSNIVIGGAAGAIPPMVGWAAVTGNIGLPALYMFAIIFFWTPPHFWALALLLKDDYTSAGIPMLPVVAGVDETKRSIFLYTLLLLALTTMFFTTRAVGWIYLVGASTLGIVFVWLAWRLMRQPGISAARTTYLFSLAYLGLIFLIIVIDSVTSL